MIDDLIVFVISRLVASWVENYDYLNIQVVWLKTNKDPTTRHFPNPDIGNLVEF